MMPLLRYFVVVGGALLALLFVVNVAFPTEPLPVNQASASDMPTIRIHSDRKGPERVVFDTNATMPAQPASTTVAVALAKPQVQPAAGLPAPVSAQITAKARVREAFAQLPPDQDVYEPRMSDMATVVVPEPKLYPARTAVKHKVAAKPRNTRPVMVVAQQPARPFSLW